MGMEKMVSYVLQGHELQNDVQTMIQVFLPNSRYSRREEPAADGLSVVSRMEKGAPPSRSCAAARGAPTGHTPPPRL